MAAWSSMSERKALFLTRRLQSLAKKPSTAFNQELGVGMKGKVLCGCRASQRRTSGVSRATLAGTVMSREVV